MSAEGRKPVDFGNGYLAGSFCQSGSWLSLAAFHPRHGTVELVGLPRFDERLRGNPDAVRRYRSWMTEEHFAFLRADVDPFCVERIEYHTVNVSHNEKYTVDNTAVEQVWRLRAPGSLVLRFRGRLAPPALAEITEVSPLPPVAVETVLSAAGTTLRVEAPALPARARVTIVAPGAVEHGWRLEEDGARVELDWTSGLELRVAVSLSGSVPRDVASGRVPPSIDRVRGTRASPRPTPSRPGSLWVDDAGLHVPAHYRVELERIAQGALRYVSECALLRTAPGEACLLTDHRLLPLSWTRDAYYQALLLLAAGEPEHVDAVADHLRWLWGRCRRDEGFWQRSHLANGEPKDVAFQGDQQLYPVLELLDFRRATGIWPEPPRQEWGSLVDELWRALPVSADGLVRTEESAADDPSLAYPLSTQILLWYATRRLAETADELGLDAAALTGAAEQTGAAVEEHFQVAGPFGPQWAHEVDLAGERRLHADANDLPTAFATLWGFYADDDARWRNTMRFAFSVANPAYCDGRLGGLGSLHTPGTWPLGDVQEWVYASRAGEFDRAERALDRLTLVAADDGLLPETYDPETGDWLARHWFAWPAAITGAFALRALEP